jgi:hypothetical protein
MNAIVTQAAPISDRRAYRMTSIDILLIWIAVVVMLYPFCRWVTSVKAQRTDWWLSYI